MPSLSERARGWSHGEYVEHRRHDVLQLVQQAIDGSVGLLLAVRGINSALHELPELEKRVRETDFLFLTGVSSECDELPLGDERQHWAPDSLREKDQLAQAFEQRIREDALTAFTRIAADLKEAS